MSLREVVAHRADHEVALAIDQARELGALRRRAGSTPTAAAGSAGRAAARSCSAPTPAVRTISPNPSGGCSSSTIFLQALALLRVLDLARDARRVHAGHQDEVASGKREVRAHRRRLARERLAHDLDHDLLARDAGAGRSGRSCGSRPRAGSSLKLISSSGRNPFRSAAEPEERGLEREVHDSRPRRCGCSP